jgi:four helix bundle protein
VFAFTATGQASRDFKFCDQIREAARSVPDNISEGFYRYAPRDFARFLSIARGSLGEVRNQLREAQVRGYLTEPDVGDLFHLSSRALGATTRLQSYLRTCPKIFDARSNLEPRT